MIASVHAGLERAEGGVIDSPFRIKWAQAVLSGRDVTYRSYDQPVVAATLVRAHKLEYLQGLCALAASGEPAYLDPELCFDTKLWEAARCACAAVLGQARAAAVGELHLCLSRPGSHHAGRDYALGGCVLNNLAVAAADALARGVPRVAIVDFDAHHGNGTQDIFYGNPAVLCISLHQYPFFPGSGAKGETGVGLGAGTTINCPLAAGTGGVGMLEAYRQALRALVTFAPRLVLFEAGLDGHVADWTSALQFDNPTFYALGELTSAALQELAVPAVFELGGGYTEEAIGGGLAALLDGLEGGQERV